MAPIITSLEDICSPLVPKSPVKTLLVNVLIPIELDAASGGSNDTVDEEDSYLYQRHDILLDENGKIAAIEDPHTISQQHQEIEEVIDCSDRLLLPGFVNGHTHSIEHWTRGLIQPLPLELWLTEIMKHEPRGEEGWYKGDSFEQTPSTAFSLSALHCGLECMLSGCTAIMDHPFVRNINDIEAIVEAYKYLGIRAFIAPMLGDDANLFENYIPLATDAQARNNACGCSSIIGCGGMAENGMFRVERGKSNPDITKQVLKLWEEAVQRFHDPTNGINIVIGPVTVQSCSFELLQGAAELRKKYDLCGHTHLLETRAQALIAKQSFPSKSAVRQLQESGFLDLPGTSCAHTVWLTDEEYDIMANAGAVCVHNPLSNLRLGSGIMPVKKALNKNVIVGIGCDGACSSDGQDMLEALKLSTIVSTMTTPEYRDWLRPKLVTMKLASKHGYAGLNMSDQAGELKVGMEADLTLWDLTSLSMLPRTDPISLLVLGSRCQAPGAGSALHTTWVRGRKVVSEGSPVGVDITKLRTALIAAQPMYRDPGITDPRKDPVLSKPEVEYRAAMGLDQEGQQEATPPEIGTFPEGRVLYSSTIP